MLAQKGCVELIHLSKWVLGGGCTQADPRNSDGETVCQSESSPCHELLLSESPPKISIFLTFVMSEWCQSDIGKNSCFRVPCTVGRTLVIILWMAWGHPTLLGFTLTLLRTENIKNMWSLGDMLLTMLPRNRLEHSSNRTWDSTHNHIKYHIIILIQVYNTDPSINIYQI